MCLRCTPSFYRVDLTAGAEFACRACTSTAAWVPILLLMILLLMAFVAIKFNSSTLGRALLEPLLIGLAYSQLVSFARLIHLSWSTEARTMLEVTSASALDIQMLSQSSCFISFGAAYFTTLGFPVALAGVLLVFKFVFTLVQSKPASAANPGASDDVDAVAEDDNSSFFRCSCRRLTHSRSPVELNALLLRSMMTVLIFAFPILAWTSLQPFDCYDVGGESRLRANADVLCGSREWWTFGIAAIFGIVFYIAGIPSAPLRAASPGRHALPGASVLLPSYDAMVVAGARSVEARRCAGAAPAVGLP
jgi:hypothetical protein